MHRNIKALLTGEDQGKNYNYTHDSSGDIIVQYYSAIIFLTSYTSLKTTRVVFKCATQKKKN